MGSKKAFLLPTAIRIYQKSRGAFSSWHKRLTVDEKQRLQDECDEFLSIESRIKHSIEIGSLASAGEQLEDWMEILSDVGQKALGLRIR